MANIEELVAGIEVELEACLARQKRILDAVNNDDRTHLTENETRDFDIENARIDNIKIRLAKARKVQAEEAEADARARESHPTSAARNNGERSMRVSPVVRSVQDSPNRSHFETDYGEGFTTRGMYAGGNRASAPVWTRDDGRPAAVERNQRFADHEIVREQLSRARDRDNAIIGQHGDLGQQMRALTTSTGSAIVPTVWAADIIDRARNYAAVYKAGAQPVVMDAKIVQIGRLVSDPAAGFRTEGSTITASDPTFDNVTLTAKTINALVVGSTEFWQDASNSGALVTEAMARALAVQIDLAALFGGVTAGAEQTALGNNMLPSGGLPNPPNPTGVLANLLANAPSSVLGGAVNGTAQTAATFYGEILDLLYTPRDFNEAPNALLWPSHLARIYAKAVDTQNNPMRVPADVENIARYVTNQIPSGFTQGTGTLMSDLVVGDFTQLLIGQRLDLTVKVLDQRYAESGQTAVLCSWRGDIAVARPRAFAVFRYLKGV